MKKIVYTLSFLLASIFAWAQSTVVDIIVNSEDHDTLEAAVIAANLVETLSGDGPFTVFAPTDDAFAALPDGLLEQLLVDPTGELANILLYHVLNGEVLSTDLSDGMVATTVLGKDITVTINNDGVFINDAKVSMADIEADNGVVHVIDAVLVPPSNTVVDIIVNSEDHNTLEAAVIAAGLVETLNGDGPFTVFAPTDDAFTALPDGLLDQLLADPAGELTNILLYHVLNGKVLSTDLSDGMTATTVLGKDITVTINNDGVFINNAKVTMADIEADNGVVHVIDAVLVPPSNTVVDIIVNSEDHNTLEAAVIAAGLVETLNGDGPFTVFAPTDDAFTALPDGLLDQLLADPAGELTNILLYHVLNGKVLSTDLSDGMTATTVLGKDITVTINNDGVFINNAKVTMADIEADNGVVHVIDAVLVPPTNTVVDIIVNSEDHNTLEAAVIAAGLVETLNGDGPFTVFAPTDDAFTALPDGLLDQLLADPAGELTNILLYHVLNGKVLSTDLSDGMTATTVLGKDITVTINSDGVFINNAKVTMADIEADNGVVHVIDAVLVPPTTVVDVIVNSEVHNTLEAAVIAAGLVDDLNVSGPFTVFAPTDAAFEALPEGLLDQLLADPAGELTDILLYHVLAGKVLSTDLSDGMTATTLQGKDINVTINDDGVFINNAKVTMADIDASNGVVHVIDAVLVPPTNTVVDVIVNSESHNTLEAAVIAAGLVETLNGEGPFTIFAPTDDAFAALPDGLLDQLLADPTGELTDILLYHVLSGKVLSTDLSDGMTATTVLGKDITVTINEDGVFINDAKVTLADIEADNGVVHVIDAVLVPPTTVVDIIVDSENHNTLEAAIIAAELVDDLNVTGPFTIFAPTDDAFAALPDGLVDQLLADPFDSLTNVLLYHVLSGKVLSTDLTDQQMAMTLQGEDVVVTIGTDGVFINEAQVTMADLEASNGVVHVIDAVLVPQQLTSIAEQREINSQIKISPNPTSNYFEVDWREGPGMEVDVRVFSTTGQVVKRWSKAPIDRRFYVEDLAPGLYIIELRHQQLRAGKQLIKIR